MKKKVKSLEQRANLFSRIFQLTFYKDRRRQEDELDLMENEIMEALKTMENGSTPGSYSLHVERKSVSGLTHRILFFIDNHMKGNCILLKGKKQ